MRGNTGPTELSDAIRTRTSVCSRRAAEAGPGTTSHTQIGEPHGWVLLQYGFCCDSGRRTSAGVNPTIAGTAFNTTGPASGSDSIELSAGAHQITITPAGSKAVSFKGHLALGANDDVLLLRVSDPLLPNPDAVKALVKVERTTGLTAL
jgi:hypothetical protein